MALARTPEWITFDCYGTLIDTRTGYVQVWRDLLADKGVRREAAVADCLRFWGEEEWRLVTGPYQKYRDILRQSVEIALVRAGLPVEDGDGQRLADAWGTFQPFPDVNPILSILHSKFKLALITNVDNDIVAQSVASMGIDFDGVFTAEKCQAYKPSRIPFEYALANIGLTPKEILHVAFGYRYDHTTAHEMGFETVWVNRRALDLPPGIPVDIEMPDLTGLPALLGL